MKPNVHIGLFCCLYNRYPGQRWLETTHENGFFTYYQISLPFVPLEIKCRAYTELTVSLWKGKMGLEEPAHSRWSDFWDAWFEKLIDACELPVIQYRTVCPHRLVAQDVALSRPKPGFESPWGHLNSAAERRRFFYRLGVRSSVEH